MAFLFRKKITFFILNEKDNFGSIIIFFMVISIFTWLKLTFRKNKPQ